MAGARGGGARIRVVAAAKPAPRDLWAYEGSAVSTIQLESYKIFHRLSFGHRNGRTHVIVLYDPASATCRAMEYEIERLALGLAHARSVSVARLNAADPEARAFLAAALPGSTERHRLPGVLVYPEGATGYFRLKERSATAEDILRGINNLYARVLPNRKPLELKGLPDTAVMEAMVYGGTEAASARQKKREKFRQLLEDVAAAREEVATVGGEAAGAPTVRTVSVVTSDAGGVWSKQRATVWGTLAGLSILAFAWDAWGAAAWDRWQLERRQEKRARGVKFSREQDLEDLGTIIYERLEEGRVILEHDKTRGTREMVLEVAEAAREEQEAAEASGRGAGAGTGEEVMRVGAGSGAGQVGGGVGSAVAGGGGGGSGALTPGEGGGRGGATAG
ncbi:hypothetical protein HYH03_015848 [Edaphochlamys debaryana]|uniref:Uncharacterized protein n=1 Tax=Edaphochlamys debaryana TaxID=47281 RepID=A0A836BQW4_9CHLO|nr:hypothetical protein HYH03_015848 [Edaphochlamys debaryana]|eukprot:KAG2485472.1 hypothetical protein HYH03_015848 [Edaphochlamys debaryana]